MSPSSQNSQNVPDRFRVIETFPAFRIEEVRTPSGRIYGVIFGCIILGIFSIACCALLMNVMPWLAALNPSSILMGAGFPVMLWYLFWMGEDYLWSALSTLTIRADHEALVITSRFRNISRQTVLAVCNFQRFVVTTERSSDANGSSGDPYYVLSVVTTQHPPKKSHPIYKKSHPIPKKFPKEWITGAASDRPNQWMVKLLISSDSAESQWLGSRLSGFYKLECHKLESQIFRKEPIIQQIEPYNN